MTDVISKRQTTQEVECFHMRLYFFFLICSVGGPDDLPVRLRNANPFELLLNAESNQTIVLTTIHT